MKIEAVFLECLILLKQINQAECLITNLYLTVKVIKKNTEISTIS